MYFDTINQKKFPRFYALLQDIKPLVDSNKHLKMELLDCTGNDQLSLDKALKISFNVLNPPYIYPTVIPIEPNITTIIEKGKKVEFLEFAKTKAYFSFSNPNFILVEEYQIILLEKLSQKQRLDSLAFGLVFIILHELSHFLRYANNVGVQNHAIHKNPNISEDELNKLQPIEEWDVGRSQARAFNFKEEDYLLTFEELSSKYSFQYAPLFRNFHKRLEKEKEERNNFDFSDFRSVYRPFERD